MIPDLSYTTGREGGREDKSSGRITNGMGTGTDKMCEQLCRQALRTSNFSRV